MTTIQVLGTGCKKCVSLKENAEAAVKELGVEADVQKIEDINEIVKDMTQFLQYEVEEEDIEFMLDLDDDLPRVLVDPKYLKQALLNVIKNAIEAIHEHGEIHIKTEPTEDGDVAVTIIDNGEGIAPDILKKIWTPFFTTKDTGTGLGLGIVKNIIEAHMGMIHIENNDTQGVNVQITLPV